MADMISDAKGEVYRRVEVLTGPRRRRDWSADEKARVVAESCVPGAVVSEVARRWQIAPQQLFTWRREARTAAMVRTSSGLSFVPVVSEPVASRLDPGACLSCPGPSLEMKLAGAELRIAPGTDAALLTMVLRAVRASAT
jgi:transposase